MKTTRRKIIAMISNVMDKTLQPWCLVEDREQGYIWTYISDNWNKHNKPTVVNYITDGQYRNAKIENIRIIGTYDMSAIENFIRQFQEWKDYNILFQMFNRDYIGWARYNKWVIKMDVATKEMKLIFELPNKQPMLYDDRQDKKLLKFLSQVQGGKVSRW